MIRHRVNLIRVAGLCILLLLALVQLPAARKTLDVFDSRPSVRILFIGNSHTFFHDMPGMVRRIADGAGVKQRYDITMHAPGGAEFRNHWENADVEELLKQPWDHVILQGASGETLSEVDLRSFLTYGARLEMQARATGGKRWFYVTWRYASSNDWIRRNPRFDQLMHSLVQAGYRRLSQATGAPLINVGKVWNEVHNARPAFSLYEPDGNHASVYGSYLAALMMFKHISGLSPETTGYRPAGVGKRDAEYLRMMAAGDSLQQVAVSTGPSVMPQ
jgi:hypothetical protein